MYLFSVEWASSESEMRQRQNNLESKQWYYRSKAKGEMKKTKLINFYAGRLCREERNIVKMEFHYFSDQ